MAVCFNHLIDENTDFLYRRLADPEPMVKRTCLMTLTFLILAGQVKVKGQLGEMAKCLEDEDKRIADLARMFFTELSTKDNAVYNHFVDMFSLLSADRRIEEESFRRIVRFLLGFVEKVSFRVSFLFFAFLRSFPVLYSLFFPLVLFFPSPSRTLPDYFTAAYSRWLTYGGDTGQTCQATRREAGREAGAVRQRAAVERCGVCAGAAAAQERGHHEAGGGGVQDGTGSCLIELLACQVLRGWLG
jgi:hypothetical protein